MIGNEEKIDNDLPDDIPMDVEDEDFSPGLIIIIIIIVIITIIIKIVGRRKSTW